MSRIFMTMLVLLLILFVGCVSTNVVNDDSPPSFRNGVKAFMDRRSGSRIDEKDKSIMIKAARDLEIAMSAPGLKEGINAMADDLWRHDRQSDDMVNSGI